jgi:heme/copper-type cytochrome/quinol oxidase subunit 2
MGVVITMLAIEGLIFIGIIVALIYLIIKRIDEKKNEDFEKRNN